MRWDGILVCLVVLFSCCQGRRTDRDVPLALKFLILSLYPICANCLSIVAERFSLFVDERNIFVRTHDWFTECSIYDSSSDSCAAFNRSSTCTASKWPQIQGRYELLRANGFLFIINFIGLLKWHWIDWCALLHPIEAIKSSFVSIKTKYTSFSGHRGLHPRQIASECQSATAGDRNEEELTRWACLEFSEIDARVQNARHRPRRHMKP